MEKQGTKTKTPQKYGPWGLRKHDEEILTLRLQGCTLQEIADKFGTSRESVRNAVARQLLSMKVKGAAHASKPLETPGQTDEPGNDSLAQSGTQSRG